MKIVTMTVDEINLTELRVWTSANFMLFLWLGGAPYRRMVAPNHLLLMMVRQYPKMYPSMVKHCNGGRACGLFAQLDTGKSRTI